MPNSSYFRDAFATSQREFRAVMERSTRANFASRQFVTVSNLIKWLNQPTDGPFHNKLDLLLRASYLSLSDKPPPITFGELDDYYIRVFLILLDMGSPQLVHLFYDRGENDTKLPFHRSSICSLPGIPEGLCEKFLGLQYRWCPVEFDLNMSGWYDDRIVPFLQKSRIPRDDSPVLLWEVNVPGELLTERLRNSMLEISPVDETISPGPRSLSYQKRRTGEHKSELVVSDASENPQDVNYTFVVKQFPMRLKPQFDQERHAYRAFRNVPGMLRNIGWYHIKEPGLDEYEESFNLVLEKADLDFSEYIRELPPPITSSEIARFWRSMLGVARALAQIHQLVVDGLHYNGWHADIKPENILVFGDELKLADPGEALIQLSRQESRPRAPVVGGTLTYGPPEKAGYLIYGQKEPAEVFQSIDVWSLGCVFSVAATWIVLGTNGVLRYERLRSATTTSVAGSSDTFHDGGQVLQVVTQWHQYLGTALRKSDLFTGEILILVDRHMLTPHDQRWDASRVGNRLEDILKIEVPRDSDDSRGCHIQQHKYDGWHIWQQARQDVPPWSSVAGNKGVNVSRTNKLMETVSEPVTVWQVARKLEKLGKPRSPPSVLQISRLKMRIRHPFDRKSTRIDDDLAIAKFYSNRDVIFLVDNGESMRDFWEQAEYVIEILAWMLLGYVKKDMELRFTNPVPQATKIGKRRYQAVEDFTDAMRRAEPRLGISTTTNMMKPLLHTLELYHNRSNPTKIKPTTIIVLTDGVWGGVAKDDTAECLVKARIGSLRNIYPSFESGVGVPAKSRFTIQFIRFGPGLEGNALLDRLDTDFDKDCHSNIIDAEPANGDVYKMLLGSISEEWGSKVNTANSPRVSIISPRTISPDNTVLRQVSQTDNTSREGKCK
ncbi:hypothetical protein F5Y19DRAFT_493701 [Xylariaceae sp. FL1651]|nr:hypothetical protein F5Y19DRAFT_493701 [Xylariaceae sp. FL1651]